MPQTKRMSAEEKSKTVLGIYHSTKSVFLEKEIVAAATKAGVNANSIVDVNQGLVDDGVVDKEKISGTNYFWSFPSKKDRMMELKHQNAVKYIEDLKKNIEDTKVAVVKAKQDREDHEADDAARVLHSAGNDADIDAVQDSTNKKAKRTSRADKLSRLQEIDRLKASAESELERLKGNDPQVVENLEKELQVVLQGANRWTDNIDTCKTYLTKKRGMDVKQACRVLGITSNFDYPVDKIPKVSK